MSVKVSGLAQSISAIAVCFATLSAAMAAVAPRQAAADVDSVSGSAFGYYTNVGLFGGPRNLKGNGQEGVTPTSDSIPIPRR